MPAKNVNETASSPPRRISAALLLARRHMAVREGFPCKDVSRSAKSRVLAWRGWCVERLLFGFSANSVLPFGGCSGSGSLSVDDSLCRGQGLNWMDCGDGGERIGHAIS